MDGLRTMISILQQFIAFKQDKTSTGQAYCLGILKGGVQLKYNDKTTVRLTLFHENCSLNSKLETRNRRAQQCFSVKGSFLTPGGMKTAV